MLVGWEAVGICSFLLINFWSFRQEANQSALKAILYNKVGDLGFMLAIFISLNILKDSDLIVLNKLVIFFSFTELYSISIIKFLGFSLILAAFGKSAQFFFHL
jgi:NADH:ubiquinone oxidoreductase subunit 5 (subunit L)/multisubunit Na+/H+ antiporter MnhA subunit